MEDEGKHLVPILLPPEDKEPSGLITWQYIWDGNIVVLFSHIEEDGSIKDNNCLILADEGELTAKEILDKMIDNLPAKLKSDYEKEHPEGGEPVVAVSNRNKKGKMGFRTQNENSGKDKKPR